MNNLTILEGYKPGDLGLDAFEEYRKDPTTGQEVQLEAIEFAAYSSARVCGLAAPTGIGKELIAVSLQKLTGLRTVIATATKGLQAQYDKNHSRYGLVDIRGRANYDCGDYANLDCRGGASMGCRYVGGGGCGYEQRKAKARNAQLVSLNYAYWFNVNDKANGLDRTEAEAELFGENPVELLILDEGHAAPDLLSEYLACRVYEGEVKRWVDPRELDDRISTWKKFINDHDVLGELEAEIRTLGMELVHLGRKATKKQVEDLHVLERTLQKMTRVASMQDDWVLELRLGTKWGRMWAFDVVWPGRYAEQYLFCGVPKIVIMSATLRPKTLGLLGVKREDYEFREWQRIFPANRHPIYNIPAKVDGADVRIDRRTNDVQLRAWVEHIDKIIDGRRDRNGIIQTVSYDRQKYLMERSRNSDLMIGNTQDPESENAEEIAKVFRCTSTPRILVSPSFSTGWDFPGKECEYIVICKVPFKPNHGKVVKAREEKDPQYGAYMAMIDMVQGAGRGMRGVEDRCEVFVVDGHLGWFLGQNKGLAPDWFVKAVRKVLEIPKAPEKLV